MDMDHEMNFESEMPESGANTEIDQELLKFQKQKSMPRVVIEEFVQEDMSDLTIKTHYEIDNVSFPSINIDFVSLGLWTNPPKNNTACTRFPP